MKIDIVSLPEVVTTKLIYMLKRKLFFYSFIFCFVLAVSNSCYSQSQDTISPRYKVTLPKAHVGSEDIDMKLLESYQQRPENIKQFYLDARKVFSENRDADFTHPRIIESARENNILLMGGPMTGNLKENGVTIWLRPAFEGPVVIKVSTANGKKLKKYTKKIAEPGVEQRIIIDGLSSSTEYHYEVIHEKQKIASGRFKTTPAPGEEGIFRLAFGSCFHKIGIHNPNLVNQILKSEPGAMMLLGDIAVDDRENNMNMHRSDYLLRDMSEPWQKLAANLPLYASWDDHDYLNNDLSGIPEGFTAEDREALRSVWSENWNNPENNAEGIYFSTRLGPVEIIMLDTRSCRNVEKRGEYGSYLGFEQQNWLRETLKNSTAPFKVISSGTMWSDYISNGKDSWGTWDTVAREEIFSLIEKENIPGVLLISGDRHGARGFSIPRPSGISLYEFEAASLGGVRGPEAMAKDTTHQLFGYFGTDVIAFGEFTFDTTEDRPVVTFRLIDQFGNILEKKVLNF